MKVMSFSVTDCFCPFQNVPKNGQSVFFFFSCATEYTICDAQESQMGLN